MIPTAIKRLRADGFAEAAEASVVEALRRVGEPRDAGPASIGGS